MPLALSDSDRSNLAGILRKGVAQGFTQDQLLEVSKRYHQQRGFEPPSDVGSGAPVTLSAHTAPAPTPAPPAHGFGAGLAGFGRAIAGDLGDALHAVDPPAPEAADAYQRGEITREELKRRVAAAKDAAPSLPDAAGALYNEKVNRFAKYAGRGDAGQAALSALPIPGLGAVQDSGDRYQQTGDTGALGEGIGHAATAATTLAAPYIPKALGAAVQGAAESGSAGAYKSLARLGTTPGEVEAIRTAGPALAREAPVALTARSLQEQLADRVARAGVGLGEARANPANAVRVPPDPLAIDDLHDTDAIAARIKAKLGSKAGVTFGPGGPGKTPIETATNPELAAQIRHEVETFRQMGAQGSRSPIDIDNAIGGLDSRINSDATPALEQESALVARPEARDVLHELSPELSAARSRYAEAIGTNKTMGLKPNLAPMQAGLGPVKVEIPRAGMTAAKTLTGAGLAHVARLAAAGRTAEAADLARILSFTSGLNPQETTAP